MKEIKAKIVLSNYIIYYRLFSNIESIKKNYI